MGDLPIVLSAHQQVNSRRRGWGQGGCEEIVEVALAVATLTREVAGSGRPAWQALKLFIHFWLSFSARGCGCAWWRQARSRARTRTWSSPRVDRGGQRQGRMQQEAHGLVAIVADGSQPASLRMGRSRAWWCLGQHNGMCLQAWEGGLDMARQNCLRFHRVVVEEPIRRLGFVPAAAGLGIGAVGCWAKSVAMEVRRFTRRGSSGA